MNLPDTRPSGPSPGGAQLSVQVAFSASEALIDISLTLSASAIALDRRSMNRDSHPMSRPRHLDHRRINRVVLRPGLPDCLIVGLALVVIDQSFNALSVPPF